MKKFVLILAVLAVTVGMAFAETEENCKRLSTTVPNNWDDLIPGWSNNTTITITDCDDGSGVIEKTVDRTIDHITGKISVDDINRKYYSPEEMESRGGNYYTSGN